MATGFTSGLTQAISSTASDSDNDTGTGMDKAIGANHWLGSSAKRTVYQQNNLRLYHFNSERKRLPKPPILIVFALVNRAYILDVTPAHSVIQPLLAAGLDVYLIDWGDPRAQDASLPLAHYVVDYLHNCVQHIRRQPGCDRLTVLGVCQGGVLSLCYSALFPDYVQQLILLATPVDFHTPENIISQILQRVDLTALAKAGKNISGDHITQAFMALKPFHHFGKKFLMQADVLTQTDRAELFFAVERWVHDCPDQAATAFCEFIQFFYQQNRLIKNSLRLAGQRVQLNTLSMPILNVVAQHDHLVPDSSAMVLEQYVASEDYTSLVLSCGHIGMFISERSRRQLTLGITDWLTCR
jgi:poly[(R)-3-hydroxyalkanoate] polymerase subunit PhaC